MSDQNINHSDASLKELNRRLKKLNKIIDRLNILAYRQKHIVKSLKDISFYCTQLIDNMDQIDVIALEVHQELGYIQMFLCSNE